MKKALFTLAILVMAFGNMGFAQRNAHLKSEATANVLKHYGVRNETTMVPQIATWQTTNNVKFHTTYSYDEYDYYLNLEYTKMDEGDGWSAYYMITYEYDFSGNVIEALGQSYETGVFENDARASYTYDMDMLSEAIYQYWDGNGWVNDTKEVYNYNGDVTTVLYWDWNGSNWTSNELYTYTYDDNSIELVIQYMQSGAWQNDERYTYALDFDENITEILVEEWAGSQWEFYQKNVYHYEGGVYTSMTIELENGAVVQKYDYTYVDGDATHGECRSLTDGNQMVPDDGELEMAYGYNAATKTYYGSEVDVTYVDVTSLNENTQATNVKVYPMPAENELIIQAEGFQKAEIYSLTGQKLMESLQTKLNVSALASGVYLLKVYDIDGHCASQRVVVK
jgi:hypothetical protein